MMAALNLTPYEKPTHGGIPNASIAAQNPTAPTEALPTLPGKEQEEIIVGGGGSAARWGEGGYTGKKKQKEEKKEAAPA